MRAHVGEAIEHSTTKLMIKLPKSELCVVHIMVACYLSDNNFGMVSTVVQKEAVTIRDEAPLYHHEFKLSFEIHYAKDLKTRECKML